ncbi:MAG: sugar phosphate nucleotidyltransferase [Candidatus Eisenbacteria bacterium]
MPWSWLGDAWASSPSSRCSAPSRAPLCRILPDHRLALSNLMRAGITRVGILSQYRPPPSSSMSGRERGWDFVGLDRTAKILPPFWGGEAGDWYQGNADAVDQNWNFLADVEADLVLVISGDHIYRTDYRELIEAHLDSGAGLHGGGEEDGLRSALRIRNARFREPCRLLCGSRTLPGTTTPA